MKNEIVKLQGYSEELNQLLCRIENCTVDTLHQVITRRKSTMETTQKCLKKQASIEQKLDNVIYRELNVTNVAP